VLAMQGGVLHYDEVIGNVSACVSLWQLTGTLRTTHEKMTFFGRRFLEKGSRSGSCFEVQSSMAHYPPDVPGFELAVPSRSMPLRLYGAQREIRVLKLCGEMPMAGTDGDVKRRSRKSQTNKQQLPGSKGADQKEMRAKVQGENEESRSAQGDPTAPRDRQ
jgi:hypothetical protein